jgi:hypothetical protein
MTPYRGIRVQLYKSRQVTRVPYRPGCFLVPEDEHDIVFKETRRRNYVSWWNGRILEVLGDDIHRCVVVIQCGLVRADDNVRFILCLIQKDHRPCLRIVLLFRNTDNTIHSKGAQPYDCVDETREMINEICRHWPWMPSPQNVENLLETTRKIKRSMVTAVVSKGRRMIMDLTEMCVVDGKEEIEGDTEDELCFIAAGVVWLCCCVAVLPQRTKRLWAWSMLHMHP